MADNQNPGQFGNRNDTEEQARKGGQQSPGQFGASEGTDPSRAGQQGGLANGNVPTVILVPRSRSPWH